MHEIFRSRCTDVTEQMIDFGVPEGGDDGGLVEGLVISEFWGRRSYREEEVWPCGWVRSYETGANQAASRRRRACDKDSFETPDPVIISMRRSSAVLP